MDNSINDLAINIRNLIKKFSQGKLSTENAELQLIELEKQYKKLKKNIKNDLNDNYLDGICYFHNIENFSIFTGIYYYSSKYFKLISYYGDSDFNKKIIYILQQNLFKIKDNELSIIFPDSKNHLNNNLYIKIKKNSDGKIFILASLSSSKFFSKDNFNYINEFIIKLLPEFKFHQFNYLNRLKEIEDFINTEIKLNKELIVYIFYFADLNNIFGHMGEYHLSQISSIIKNNIINKFGNSTFFSCPSYTDYIVISNINQYNEKKIKAKINFSYKNIPIPYTLKSIKLEGENSYYQFTDLLFSTIN